LQVNIKKNKVNTNKTGIVVVNQVAIIPEIYIFVRDTDRGNVFSETGLSCLFISFIVVIFMNVVFLVSFVVWGWYGTSVYITVKDCYTLTSQNQIRKNIWTVNLQWLPST
jgi:hypothetical protein